MEEEKVSKLESTIVPQVARDAAMRDLQAVVDASRVQDYIKKEMIDKMNQKTLDQK